MWLLTTAASAALIAVVALSAAAASTVESRPPATTPVTIGAPTPTATSTLTAATTATPTGRMDATGPAAIAPRVSPNRGFVWPLSPRPALLRPFEQPHSQWSSGHRGVDLAAVVGQAVFSAGDGVVAFSGVIAGRGVITVSHSGGLRTTYEPVDQRLAAASVVHRGSPIGVVSATPGHCLPLTCLHWGALSGQVYRDPLSLLGFGRPILLPLG
jgi:murein DD-endopeptidase MepM/ murein hydrolase activator NlpD